MAGGRLGDMEAHDSIGDGIKLGDGNDDGEKALVTSGGVGGVGDGGTKFNAGGAVGRVSLSKLEILFLSSTYKTTPLYPHYFYGNNK